MKEGTYEGAGAEQMRRILIEQKEGRKEEKE